MSLKSVISVSRRSDIPAFYLDWFIERIRSGFVDVENPLYPKQVRTVDLSPEAVGWIVFWSRNYSRFLKNQAFFRDYRLFFHFTIVPRSIFDAHAPETDTSLRQLDTLAGEYGPEYIIWRYDPILFWIEGNELHTNHSIEQYEYLCKHAAGTGINMCYISLVNPYKKFLSRIKRVLPHVSLTVPSSAKLHSTLKDIVAVANHYGIKVYVCSNENLESVQGIFKARCIDGAYLNHLSGGKVVSEAKTASRTGCGCTRSTDIGSYRLQPCHYGCLYCYANPVLKQG